MSSGIREFINQCLDQTSVRTEDIQTDLGRFGKHEPDGRLRVEWIREVLRQSELDRDHGADDIGMYGFITAETHVRKFIVVCDPGLSVFVIIGIPGNSDAVAFGGDFGNHGIFTRFRSRAVKAKFIVVNF